MNGRQEHHRITCEVDGQTYGGNRWMNIVVSVADDSKMVIDL